MIIFTSVGKANEDTGNGPPVFTSLSQSAAVHYPLLFYLSGMVWLLQWGVFAPVCRKHCGDGHNEPDQSASAAQVLIGCAVAGTDDNAVCGADCAGDGYFS